MAGAATMPADGRQADVARGDGHTGLRRPLPVTIAVYAALGVVVVQTIYPLLWVLFGSL